jgi:cell wall-associated NlpC family hydrolase
LGSMARSYLNFARRFPEVSRLGRRKRLENWWLAALSAKRTTSYRGTKLRWLRASATVAAAAIATACASSGAVPRPFPTPNAGPVLPAKGDQPEHSTPASPNHRIDAFAMADTALALRGTPYRNGGSDPTGFDCSGFVQYVFAQHGIALPRDVKAQFEVGDLVSLDELELGDLVFFTTVAPGVSHVGLSLGGDEFVHAPSSKGVVRVERISAAYWSRRVIGARRLRNQ